MAWRCALHVASCPHSGDSQVCQMTAHLGVDALLSNRARLYLVL
jgi:hypothetical protein